MAVLFVHLHFTKLSFFSISAVHMTVNILAAFVLHLLFASVIENVSECSRLVMITHLGMTTNIVGFKITFLDDC